MAVTQTKYESGFSVLECCKCSLPFGVTANFERLRREDHEWFYCPAGHPQHFPAESDVEKFKRKSEMLADQVRMEREQREKAERKLARIQRGVCPHCNRSFKALERHMKSKHGVQ